MDKNLEALKKRMAELAAEYKLLSPSQTEKTEAAGFTQEEAAKFVALVRDFEKNPQAENVNKIQAALPTFLEKFAAAPAKQQAQLQTWKEKVQLLINNAQSTSTPKDPYHEEIIFSQALKIWAKSARLEVYEALLKLSPTPEKDFFQTAAITEITEHLKTAVLGSYKAAFDMGLKVFSAFEQIIASFSSKKLTIQNVADGWQKTLSDFESDDKEHLRLLTNFRQKRPKTSEKTRIDEILTWEKTNSPAGLPSVKSIKIAFISGYLRTLSDTSYFDYDYDASMKAGYISMELEFVLKHKALLPTAKSCFNDVPEKVIKMLKETIPADTPVLDLPFDLQAYITYPSESSYGSGYIVWGAK